MRKLNRLLFTILIAGLLASCSSSKVDYASAYKFSRYNYNNTVVKAQPQESLINEEVVAESATSVEAGTAELLAAAENQMVAPSIQQRMEQAQKKADNSTVASNKKTKLNKNEKKELRSLIKREVKKIKELKDKKSVDEKNDLSRNGRTGLIIGIVGLALMLIGTATFYTIGAILFIVGLVLFLIDVL